MTKGFEKNKIKPTNLVGFIMKISKKTQYGLRAMIYLARQKHKICSLREIAKKEKIPFDYLEKIILKLRKSGLVKAKKGTEGGYFLAKKPEKIKIGQIINALEGQTLLVSCLKYFCPMEKKCLAKNFWRKLSKSLISSLNSESLANLIR